jgi:methionine biosynthesis protein MetW
MAIGPDPALLRAARAFAYENPRPDVQALVPQTARRILDLGCASGVVGAALMERQQCEVVGIELDPEYARAAQARLDRVVCADLEQLSARDDLEAELGSFDCVVAGDVLEHLREPERVLARFTALLEPGATAVVSLPNVRYWETFWQLAVRGTWPRRSEGIFDRTHLRWFTLRDAYALFDAAGLDVVQVNRQMRIAPGGSRWEQHAPKLERTPLRTLFTFQHVIAGRRR